MAWKFPLFEAVDSAGPPDIEEPVDWKLIEQIDPQLIRHQPFSRKLGKFLKHFPYYRLSSADSLVLSHPLSVRFFLIVQSAFSSLVRSISRYRVQIQQQTDTISHLSEQLSAERSLHASSRDLHHQAEKCYACGKRFLTIRHLNDHFTRRHKPLVTSWQKITSNDFLDENTELISDLKAQIHDLKAQLYQLYQTASTPPPPPSIAPPRRPSPAPKVTYFAVQPKFAPYCPVSETPQRPPKLEEIATANVYDEIVGGEDAIQHEAERRERRARRQFDTVRTCLRVRLEHAVPLPRSLQSESSRTADSVPPLKRESQESVDLVPSVEQVVLVTDLESESRDPFVLEGDSDESNELQSRPLLLSDHMDSSG
jgi:hypothetical protein